jgi:hypothetical protein
LAIPNLNRHNMISDGTSSAIKPLEIYLSFAWLSYPAACATDKARVCTSLLFTITGFIFPPDNSPEEVSPVEPSEDNSGTLHNLSIMPGSMQPEFFQYFKELLIVLGEICLRVFFHLGYEVTLVLTTQYF